MRGHERLLQAIESFFVHHVPRDTGRYKVKRCVVPVKLLYPYVCVCEHVYLRTSMPLPDSRRPDKQQHYQHNNTTNKIVKVRES